MRHSAHSATDETGDRLLVLVAAPDGEATRYVVRWLRVIGYDTRTAPTVREALRDVATDAPAGVVVGRLLPHPGAWELVRLLRAADPVLPIVVVAKEYETDDETRAYREGADDYLTYRTRPEQYRARFDARMRRVTNAAAQGRRELGDDRLRVDRTTHEAWVDGRPLDLTPTEFELAVAFLRHPGQVLGREQLVRLAWHEEPDEDSTRVKYAVQRLRRKMDRAAPGTPSRITAVRGIGYRYEGAP
ncbi:hypothetical protein GTY65_16795 [Streptomyces sp. SID8379]|uniref:response regulator transcription factor n=1 Tax=unclassified Streptomyces TaxID=2593676 RepID=UPI00037AD04F|nr:MULTISPECIES: response regulator transcription factor [unclassified Streptomyces]MYW65701.1 hypothetical protein [Streptomyces sp. SID8379]